MPIPMIGQSVHLFTQSIRIPGRDNKDDVFPFISWKGLNAVKSLCISKIEKFMSVNVKERDCERMVNFGVVLIIHCSKFGRDSVREKWVSFQGFERSVVTLSDIHCDWIFLILIFFFNALHRRMSYSPSCNDSFSFHEFYNLHYKEVKKKQRINKVLFILSFKRDLMLQLNSKLQWNSKFWKCVYEWWQATYGFEFVFWPGNPIWFDYGNWDSQLRQERVDWCSFM